MIFGDIDDPRVYGPVGIVAGAIGLVGGAVLVLYDRFKASRMKVRAAEFAQDTAEEKAKAELEAARVKARADLEKEAEARADKRDQKMSANLQKMIARLERERDADRRQLNELQAAYQKHVTDSLARERECERRQASLEGEVRYMKEKLADTQAEIAKLERENGEFRAALGWSISPGAEPGSGVRRGDVTPHGPDSPPFPPGTGPA